MKFFRKKPPIWYVLKPARIGQPYEKLGPFERTAIATMYKNGQLGGGALIWTNERIFANPKKPNSSRAVRLNGWKRFDELPDPTQQQIIALAQNPEPHPQVQQPIQQQSLGGSGDEPDEEEIPPPMPPPGGGGGYMAPAAPAPGGYPVQAPPTGGYPTPAAPMAASGPPAGYPPQGPSAGGYLTPSGPGVGGYAAPPQHQPNAMESAYGPPMHQPYPTQNSQPAQPQHPVYPQPPPGYPGTQ